MLTFNSQLLYRFKLNLFHKVFIGLIGILWFSSTKLFSQIRINEILTSNLTINYDDKYNYPGWVELYNGGSSLVYLGGYYLSDSKAIKTKWMIPNSVSITGKGYALLFFDGLNTGNHANFVLDPKGGTLYLSNAQKVVIDSVHYQQQYGNISFGRLGNGADWGYSIHPSPLAVNDASACWGQPLPLQFSIPSARYSSSQTLTITSGTVGAQIRYTIDGSEPTPTSALYTTPINITKTTIVKAKVINSGIISGPTYTKTYFINEHTFTLPVVSISMNPVFLTDNLIGIYVTGTNGLIANCLDVPKNWNRDWERASVVQILDRSGNELFSQGLDAKISGKCSRNSDQKSMAFEAHSKFPERSIDYPLFKTKNLAKYDAFVLRNSGNDFNVVQFRDGLMQEILHGKMDVDLQGFQPTTVYLNGQYWGIMNMREKIDADYVKSNFNIQGDSIDMLEFDGDVIEGSSTDYINFKNKLKTLNLSLNSTYDYIAANIDVPEFINYLVAEIYYGNTDWPGNNIKYWKSKRPGSKWRWIMFDTDFGFALYPDWSSSATHKTFDYLADSVTTVVWPNPTWSTLLYRTLIKNPRFKKEFIQTMQSALNSTFNPTRVIGIIDSIAGLVAAEMPYHKARWWGTITDWNNEVAKLKTFAVQRHDFMNQYVKDYFKLSATSKIDGNVVPEGAGKVLVNFIDITGMDTVEVFNSLPYNAEALPANGYKFKQWQINTRETQNSVLIKRGDLWKYDDSGIFPGSTWILGSFDDSSWSEGVAELGYGDGNENKVIGYGPDVNNKYITTWFRKTITVDDTAGIRDLDMNIMFDDGAVVYINGVEAARFNMPAGVIQASTLSSANADEGIYISKPLNTGLLKPGQNTVAVEIHQVSGASSDISFDMDLTMTREFGGISYTLNNRVINDTVKASISFVAEFEPKEPVTSFIINEISAAKASVTDEYNEADDWFEVYNPTNDTIDLAGLYVTDNLKTPCKYKIANTRVGDTHLLPMNFKVLWADDQLEQGNLHCPFKLSADGEQIGFYQIVGKDTLVIDTLTYCEQKDKYSYAQFPDGSGNWIFTNVLTPEEPNKESVPVVELVGIIEMENSYGSLDVFPNPTDDVLEIKLPNVLVNKEYKVYDQMGQLVKSGILSPDGKINCREIHNGVYMLILEGNDKNYRVRFLVLHN